MAEISKIVSDYMSHIKNVKLVLDVALFYNDKCLLVKYKDTNKYDHQKGWFLPDDYFADGEHPDETAERILKEQLGLDNKNASIDHFESFIGNDKSWHLIFHYKLALDEEPKLKPSADIDNFEWFGIDILPPDSEIAHKGWAKYVIQEILNMRK
jgi:ADP-ribose pyrophosphatase YjhB (NUDIX family)